MRRAAVLNGLPFLYFCHAGYLDILTRFYSPVVLPSRLWFSASCQAVFRDSPSIERQLRLAEASADPLGADPLPQPADWEAMHVAATIPGAILLLEGRHLRQVARHHGLETTGTVGMMLQAGTEGLAGPVDQWLPRLRKEGLLVSSRAEKMLRALEAQDNPDN